MARCANVRHTEGSREHIGVNNCNCCGSAEEATKFHCGYGTLRALPHPQQHNRIPIVPYPNRRWVIGAVDEHSCNQVLDAIKYLLPDEHKTSIACRKPPDTSGNGRPPMLPPGFAVLHVVVGPCPKGESKYGIFPGSFCFQQMRSPLSGPIFNVGSLSNALGSVINGLTIDEGKRNGLNLWRGNSRIYSEGGNSRVYENLSWQSIGRMDGYASRDCGAAHTGNPCNQYIRASTTMTAALVSMNGQAGCQKFAGFINSALSASNTKLRMDPGWIDTFGKSEW